MKKVQKTHGFALVATLILMALIVVVIVAYLGNTRTDRATSSAYANRLRAKTFGDAGLAAAVRLLYDNTKTGDYITAMPATSPVPHRLELYRPSTPSDYLRIDNAIGEILVSRANTTSLPAPTPQVDPRPAATTIAVPPAGSSFGLSDPGFGSTNSYDFNQIVRVGSTNAGRLVDPDAQPAFGQWVRVRNTSGDLIGRYAFFIEDESMKVNVNFSGNNLGGGVNPNLRVNDLVLPAPASTPTSQIQEIDPAASLRASEDRPGADSALMGVGAAGSRLHTMHTVGLLDQWKTNLPEYAHLLTILSRDSNTTARGWKRMDLNNIVAANSPSAAARKIADWIRDAWTGPTAIAALKQDPDGRYYQLYNNERLRLQIAANIIDYIDADNIPTDLGDIVPDTGLTAVPVIGIEKIPQLSAVFVIYQAQDRAIGATPGRTSAKVSMKLRFNFINLFDIPLDLQILSSGAGSAVLFDKIEVKGIPVITKFSEKVFDKSTIPYSVLVSSLKAVQGSGSSIPAGQDGVSGSGVRSFETDWLVLDEVREFKTGSSNPIFSPTDQMEVSILGPANTRIAKTAMTWSDTPSTGYRQSGTTTPGSTSSGDFLMDSVTGALATPTIPGVPRQIAAIFTQESSVPSGAGTLTRQFGDPRFRPDLLNEPWRRANRTDTESAFTASALQARVDQVDMEPRTAGCDWYDQVNDRPLAFIRNGPIRGIGELGHIAAAEYPWRTLYLQHPERPVNSTSPIVQDEVATKRRMESLDWVLTDLFKTSNTDVKSGGINVNSRFAVSGDHRVIDSLLLGAPVGDATATQQLITSDVVRKLVTNSGSTLVTAITDRRNLTSATPENDPVRPFFQIGQFAPVLSRLFSMSKLVAGESRSTVIYSALRSTPENSGEVNVNYRSDMQVEQAFRELSDSVTTRGDVFRILYVGQSIRDISRSGVRNGAVDGPEEIAAEYLGEVFVERRGAFVPVAGITDATKTSDSAYSVLSARVITE